MFTSPRGGFFKTIPCPFFIPSSSETSSQQRSCLKSAEHCHFLHSQPPPAPQLVKRSKSSKAGSAERQRLTAAAIVQQQPITSTSQASISTSFHSSSSSSAGGDGSVSGGGSGLKRLVAELEGFGGDLTYSSSSTTIRSLPSSSTPKHIKPVVHSIQKRAISSLLATENPVSAHVGSVGAPKIKSDLRAKVTRDQRQKTLDKFYSEFLRIYSSLMNCQLLAHEHSLTQETSVHEKSTKATYVTLSIGVLKRLRSRPVSTGGNDVGIDGEWTLPKTIPSKNDILKETRSLAEAAEKFIVPLNILEDAGFPILEKLRASTTVPPAPSCRRKCDRCNKDFDLVLPPSPDSLLECKFHYGFKSKRVNTNGKERQFSCCRSSVDSPGCCDGPHVFKTESNDELHSLYPFRRLPPSSSSSTHLHPIVALDCEMSYTTRGFEVTRVTIASSSKTESNTLLDLVVKPIGLLLDANTRWSGLSPERIETGYDVRFEDLYEKLSSCLSSETIIIGHGLENDMKVLRIAHERIIDTSVLFPHPNGLPYRHSLRVLCSQHLQRLIQTGNGHDSFEDARACVDLLWYKLK